MSTRRFEMAIELADDAELLVREAERAVEDAGCATARDIAETRLQEAMQLQDQVLADVAPVIEDRERQLREAVREAVRSLQGDPAAPWHAKHRRFMSPAVKARIIQGIGRKAYEAA